MGVFCHLISARHKMSFKVTLIFICTIVALTSTFAKGDPTPTKPTPTTTTTKPTTANTGDTKGSTATTKPTTATTKPTTTTTKTTSDGNIKSVDVLCGLVIVASTMTAA